MLSGIFAELKLYKPHTEGSEESRSNVSVLVSGCVQWSKAPKKVAFIFTFHLPFIAAKGSRAKEQWAQGLPAVFMGEHLESLADLWE